MRRRDARPPARGGRPNALFVVAAAEAPPRELIGLADEVRILFPWGSLLRGVLGQDNRLLVPTALVGGGAFLLAADTLARNIVAPAELSVGVITAFCGAPFFVWVLRGRGMSTV